MTFLQKNQVSFPPAEDMGPRDWGKETLLVLVPGEFSLKKLFVRAGSRGGLQYHHKKNECGYLVSGQMIIRFDEGDGILTEKVINAGDSFHFPPGAVHQEEAVVDCVIIEASTPHFNDRVRMEEQYGMMADGGLPSTTIDDVETR